MNATLERERPAVPLRGAHNISPDQLQQAFHWLMTSDKLANDAKTALLASVWFTSVESFHEQEDQFLMSGRYETSLSEHRCLLSNLIAKGEQILLAAKQNGIDPDAPFKIGDVEAAVESLHIAFHAEHRNGNSDAINQQIAALFPDVA